MGRHVNDITGQIFGTLKVIRQTDQRTAKGQVLWECKCLTCNNIAYATSSDLKRGRRQYCKTCRDNIAKNSPLKSLYNNYKRSAEKREYEFNLSFELFCEIISKECYYCHSKPMQYFKKENSREGVVYNGIDRINNEIGYIKDNVVPCCKFCNLAKNTFPVEEFLKWLERVKKQ